MKILLILSVLILIALPLSAQQEDKNTGRTAPSITLEDINGDVYRLQDNLGKGPIIVSFWATWCQPCKQELPKMNDLLETYGEKGLSMIAVSVDDEKTVSKVEPYVKSKGYSFTVLYDTNSETARDYYVYSVPYTLIIDKDGKIAYSHLGYKSGDELEVESKIKELLGM